jgi:phosphoglycolate phosphatase-like HAD superfamily hydrolase
VLFDIDGTLVAGGPAKEAFRLALVSVFGTAGPIRLHEFAGKTDPQIARELLGRAGLSAEEIEAGFPRLWDAYVEELTRRLPETPMERLPGVPELLVALEEDPGAGLGLVTGNIGEGARLKLESAGLAACFPEGVGGFGSDDERREYLPRLAMMRAADRWGLDFDPGSVVVVGDTPRDVDCGKKNGTRTVAVATGRYSRQELEEAGADVVLGDLSRVAEVAALLLDD